MHMELELDERPPGAVVRGTGGRKEEVLVLLLLAADDSTAAHSTDLEGRGDWPLTMLPLTNGGGGGGPPTARTRR